MHIMIKFYKVTDLCCLCKLPFSGLRHRWDSRLESTYGPTSLFEGLPSYFDVNTKSEGMKTVSMKCVNYS